MVSAGRRVRSERKGTNVNTYFQTLAEHLHVMQVLDAKGKTIAGFNLGVGNGNGKNRPLTFKPRQGSDAKSAAWKVLDGTAKPASVRFGHKAAGDVVLGTDDPIMQIIVANGAYFATPLPAVGVKFFAAISAASTTADMGNTGSADGVLVHAQVR